MSSEVDQAVDRFIARFLEVMRDDIHELIGVLVSEYGNPIAPDGSVRQEFLDAQVGLVGMAMAKALHAALMPPVDPSQPVN